MDRGYVVTGMTSFGFGGDLWLAKLNCEPTDVNNNSSTPAEYALYQNYPNPFNPKTKIRFKLAKRGFTTLKVFDVIGNEIMILVNEEKPAGSYEVEFNAFGLPSGIYFYSLVTTEFNEVNKMILLK